MLKRLKEEEENVGKKRTIKKIVEEVQWRYCIEDKSKRWSKNEEKN